MLSTDFPIGVAIYRKNLIVPMYHNDFFTKEFSMNPGEKLFGSILIEDQYSVSR